MKKEKSNIILIGMPASGKSTVGVVLAKVIGYGFIDTDILIQQREKMRLCRIIEERGVEGFLEIENAVNASVDADRSVIATGGSAVYGKEAMEHLSRIGVVIYLKVSFETIEARLHNIKGRGVALREGQTLQQLYDERARLYEKYADLIVEEEGGVEDVVVQIMKRLNNSV